MTRLPADDSFFPSPALDTDQVLASTSGTSSAHASSSVISPLSLPGAAHYFDQPPHPSVTSHPLPGPTHMNFSSLMTGETCGPPQVPPPNFLSPHLTPIPSHAQYQLQFQRHPQQRAASLSPTRRSFARGNGRMDDGRRSPDVDLPARSAPGLPVPVDTISGTGSGLITIRRPALRSTSTDSYSAAESQSLSLEARMRQAWDEERRALQASRDRAEDLYRDAIEALRGEHASAQARWEAERYRLQTHITLLQNRLRKSEARWNETSMRGGGLDSRSISFQGSSSSQLSPTGQPEPLLALHNDNITPDQTIAMDHETPSKVIDVQEYHKDLEGIHLKVNAVKKATFTDTPSSSGSKTSSGGGSPSHTPEERRELARERCVRALKADPLSRLTMNAGHTPTVSMSFASTGATNTVTSSGSNTPTLTSGDGAISSDGNDGNDGRESKEPVEPVASATDDADHGPAIMEPSDEDPELRGPLTLRNMPAKDEIFLRKLADKLEQVAEDATPTVLKDAECDKGEPSAQAAPVPAADDDSDGEDAEPDIPLKLRSTSNFGKPLGSL